MWLGSVDPFSTTQLKGPICLYMKKMIVLKPFALFTYKSKWQTRRERAQPGLNWWPIGLQPIALPLSYTPIWWCEVKLSLIILTIVWPFSNTCHVMNPILNAIIICFCHWRTTWLVGCMWGYQLVILESQRMFERFGDLA